MKKLKAIKTSLVLALVATLICGFSSWHTPRVKAINSAGELFANPSGVTITKDAEAPDTFIDYKGNTIARDFDLGMRGVQLNAESTGASVQLSPTFESDFSMTFRAYSDVSFGADQANEFNTAKYVMTDYADLREISFIFEDENGKTFTVAIAAGEKYNVITPAARVVCGRTKFGYHYLNDATLENNTPAQNSSGYFTRIGGTTFCNVTRTGGAITSAKSHPVTFGFNLDTMEVYVIHYGITVEKEEYRLVADLDSDEMAFGKIESFGNYKVTVQFSDIARGRDANVIIYDINGQSLAGETFTDNVGPTTKAAKPYDAVVGRKYLLPKPSAYDLIEGGIDFAGTLEVNGGASKVYDASGAVTTTWSEGCYFIPETLDEYEVRYQAIDSKGNEGIAKTFIVNVLESLPEWSLNVKGGNYTYFENNEVVLGTGSSFTVYPVKASSRLLSGSGNKDTQVFLTKNGVSYGGLNGKLLTEEMDLVLEAGEYELLYNIKGLEDVMFKKYTFTVSDSAPVFTFNTKLPSLVESGKQFTLPKATVELNGSKTLANATVYDPDGSLVPISNNSIMIDKIGVYKINYLARLGGATYTYETHFNTAYSTDGLFTSDTTTVIAKKGDSGNFYTNPIRGIDIKFQEGGKYATYTKTLDLSKLSRTEPFIKLMVIPKTYGVLDFWQYNIRLTDVHDAENYVDILVFKGSWGNAFAYVKAGASNQKPGGWEMGTFLTNYNAGTPILHSFTGESGTGTEEIVLYYDYEDKAVIVDNIKRPGYSYGNEVADLDGLDCFNENTLFGGFTTGEVYLSICVEDIQGDTAELLITEINGINLSEDWIDDKTAPVIGIDTIGYSDGDLPVGVIGNSYPIFNANAFDSADGNTPLSVTVYKDYQTLNQVEIEIVDGRFACDAVGEYTIIYSAKDKSGNKTSKELTVTVVESVEDYEYIFNEPLQTEYNLGNYLNIPSGYATGGSGRAQAELVVMDPNGERINQPHGALIDQEGTYVICIVFSDYLGREKTISYPISATISESPIVYETGVPQALVNGVEYILPDFDASDYSTGTYKEPTKSIIIKYNGNETVLGADRKFTPNVANHQDEIKIMYRATNENGAFTDYEYSVKVLVVKNENDEIDMSAFFALKDATAGAKTSSYVEFDTQTEGAKLDFVNPLIANNLAFELYVPKAKNNFSNITITLTDFADRSIAISFDIVKNSAAANYSYLEYLGASQEVAGNFFDLTSYGFSLIYNNTSKSIFDSNSNKNIVKIEKTINGEEFNGFPSGRAFISFTFGRVTGKSALQVRLLGNQNFSHITNDRVLPQIQLMSFISRSGEINVPFTVPAAVAADVLNAEVTLSVTIKRGSTVLHTGSIDKEYIFTPTEYGTYRIEYTAKAGGRSSTLTCFVRVRDRVKPTLSITGEVPTSGKIGRVIELPNATVSDNYTEDVKVYIYITEPNGRMILLDDGVTSFTPNLTGRYRVSYYVADEYSNYVYQKFIITVQ